MLTDEIVKSGLYKKEQDMLTNGIGKSILYMKGRGYVE